MGFSPQQARVALAATDTGLDVQAALETLLSNGAGATDDSAEPPEVRPRRRERPADRYGDADNQDSTPHESSRPEMPRRPSARTRPSQEPPEANYQQHADKLIAQASEIGLTMFNRANALWNQSKEKVQKAYEERAAAARAGSANRPTSDGRPKWMQDSLDVEESGRRRGSGSRTESIYDDNVESPPSRPSKQRPTAQGRPQPHVNTEDLLSDDAPKAYISPFRRGKPPAAAPSPPAYKSAPPRTPSPIRLVQRQTISATPSAIAASAKYKVTGTESFKLGQFAEAESAYSSAISQLPDSHILLIPLLNNRALTRLKTGNTSGAIEDCTTVISVIGPSYHPSREAKLTKEDEGATVDLADALVKAWKRRAEAYEGREKWDLARKDWEAIASVDFAGRLRSEAVSGAARCRKMLISDPGDDSGTNARPSPSLAKVPRRPPQKRPTPPSAALNRLQQANKAAEAEDDARYELKDSIDARLATWKQGKETNLRALIASLDTVLWPELGWQKVGMAELVTPNQVKIRYTKAIAKLHPDKLNVKNTTLEQRMVANGVFGSLNDAWNAFKP
ncbi:hypothetical protein HETIRDRAFT_472650 [Heterobasidion irregulare TC 32-1]|uniref:UBA domain-containing protein n=1 Tax=Heterobasidion irregulare (strain TC 32-1) TaxID=747525 RepID=W4KED5_HETIT|nr:uncharacterized protein HETIRDRAFT_472650 [Heterobasidion irregulare TC 32-1]ETW84178.1 hypothetical protein HETIRDRAFT_472650 [Heterobasidion irregulare TC 32-1]